MPQTLPDSSYARLCSHEFLWPRRAAEGHYYQVCLLCGAKYKYDWKSMQRIERVDTELKAAPRLSLLLELEPAHRVFFRNLADVLLFRSTPPAATTSRPAPFWRDVFVCSGVPWRWLLGSTVSHMIAIAAMLILSQWWAQREPLQHRRTFYKSYVSYYMPSPSFPALRSSASRVRALPRRKPESAHQAVLRVAPERRRKIIQSPDIKRTESAPPNVLASNPARSAMPLSSNKLTLPAVPNSVVASLSDFSYATARRHGLPQGSVVAPPPEVKAVSLRRGITTPNAAVVGPPPTVHSSIRKVGDINIGQSGIVEPSPQLPMHEQRTFSGMPQAILGSLATSVVPPPPSAQRSGTLADRRVSSLSSTGPQVVPPAPSVRDVGNSAGGARVNSLSSTGLQVVPPAPSVQDAVNPTRDGPASSLSSTGLQVVSPPAAVQGTANSGTGGRAIAMSIPPVVTSPSQPVIDNPRGPVDNPRGPVTEEMAIRLIGLALALPSSSYFSNYEVFIAERRISKVASQLIKLVYVSLPYQRRLSEYGLNNSRVYKLRVSRDRTCDESLLQMTWPENDPHPGSQYSTDSPGLSPNDRSGMLPCYRTTADDYRRALSRGR